MKKSFLLLFVSLSLLASDRMSGVIEEVSKLRVNYEKCKENLNDALNGVVVIDKEPSKDANKKIADLEKQLKEKEVDFHKSRFENSKLEDKILTLEEEIRSLKRSSNVKVIKEVVYKERDSDESEVMPELLSKNDTVKIDSVPEASIETFEPSSFKATSSTFAYDAPRGNIVMGWEDGRSFTSNTKKGDWIKVTGYFIEGKWTSARKAMWIEEKFTIKR